MTNKNIKVSRTDFSLVVLRSFHNAVVKQTPISHIECICNVQDSKRTLRHSGNGASVLQANLCVQVLEARARGLILIL